MGYHSSSKNDGEAVYTEAHLDLAWNLNVEKSRRSFWSYRQFMRPKMKLGWFQRQLARELQSFWEDLQAGLRPILVIEAPPQHGKSESIVDAIQWFSGLDPNLQTIYASFSDRLGIRANLRIQRAMDSEKYKAIFPETRLNSSNVVTMAGRFQRNHEMLEFVGHNGSFRNTTILGSVTGETLGLGVIDDPLKGRIEANSLNQRDKVWDWFNDDFMTRFSEHAGLLIILTRWHIDDPVGRLQLANPNVRVLRYPALAERNEWLTKDGRYLVADKAPAGSALLRRRGEPLFPELKSSEFILSRKKTMTIASFEAIYQQNPIVVGGDTFPIERIETVPYVPKGVKVTGRVRYWDKAGTSGSGKYSAGVLMATLSDGRILIEHVHRRQLNAFDRETLIKQTAIDDGRAVPIYVEQEPGSGGKESAERTIANLKGYVAEADRVTGDKETRAEPYAAQVQAGNVILLAGPWNQAYLQELEYFPNGPYKDQVDASSGAFAKLTSESEKKAGVLW